MTELSTKTTINIFRRLRAWDFPSSMFEADREVRKILEPFDAESLGCGTFLPTLTRDWDYELDAHRAHEAAVKLTEAGYQVKVETRQ